MVIMIEFDSDPVAIFMIPPSSCARIKVMSIAVAIFLLLSGLFVINPEKLLEFTLPYYDAISNANVNFQDYLRLLGST